MSNRASNFNGLCGKIGLNPWCMNEGRATGDEEYELEEEVAKEFGLI